MTGDNTQPTDDQPTKDDDAFNRELTQPDSDFMAGAILANGITFIWMQLLSIMRDYFLNIPQMILVDISYLIYTLSGYISSRQVTKRIKLGHLKAGLKTASYSSIMGLLIIYTMFNEPSFTLAITISVCYFFGSIIGSYMELNSRIKKR